MTTLHKFHIGIRWQGGTTQITHALGNDHLGVRERIKAAVAYQGLLPPRVVLVCIPGGKA